MHTIVHTMVSTIFINKDVLTKIFKTAFDNSLESKDLWCS